MVARSFGGSLIFWVYLVWWVALSLARPCGIACRSFRIGISITENESNFFALYYWSPTFLRIFHFAALAPEFRSAQTCCTHFTCHHSLNIDYIYYFFAKSFTKSNKNS
jgi:hypothetical protein